METGDSIRFLGDMTKLDLKPGDMLVLQLDQRISDEHFKRLNEQMAEIFGKRLVVILDQGMKLGAVIMPTSVEASG